MRVDKKYNIVKDKSGSGVFWSISPTCFGPRFHHITGRMPDWGGGERPRAQANTDGEVTLFLDLTAMTALRDALTRYLRLARTTKDPWTEREERGL